MNNPYHEMDIQPLLDITTLWDLAGICDALENTDYYGRRILITKRVLREALEEMEVIKTSIRGSSYAGPRYGEFDVAMWKAIEEEING